MEALTIKVRFLDRLYHGRKNDREAEWPPSPFRLFQAILAGSGEEAGSVLRWLENCNPPQITAPEIIGDSALTLPGLKNNGDKGHGLDPCCNPPLYLDGQRVYSDSVAKRILRTTMRQALDSDRLTYTWSVDMSSGPGLEAIQKAVRKIHRLGSSRDFVVCGCEVTDKMTHIGNMWVPGYKGTTLRIPTSGSYESLVNAFNIGPHYGDGGCLLNSSKNISFDECSYGKHNDNQYAVFNLVSVTGRRIGIEPWRACEVAAWVRHALCDAAQRSDREFPGGSDLYVAGHCHDKAGKRLYDEEAAKLAYVPLPSIVGPYPDGLIRRVMVAGFGGINHAKHIEWVRRALSGVVLTDDFGRDIGALVEDDSGAGCFAGESDSWFSVTPVVLPGYDRGGPQTVKLVRKVLGYANVGDVEFDLSWPVCGMPVRYKVPEKMVGRSLRFLRLRFGKRVPGPVVLGIGRYCGLGVFARG